MCSSAIVFERGVRAWCSSVVFERGVRAWCSSLVLSELSGRLCLSDASVIFL